MKLATLGALCLSAVARADESYGPPSDQSVETFANWYADFAAMRDTTAAGLNLSVYDEQALLWARTSFIQPQLMLHDKFIFDRASGNWTVTKYLDDVTARYGGIDSVLLWPTYPNIGVDDRNQYDMHASMPGGLPNLAALVDELHAAGVHVLWPYNPWDQYTRDTGVSDEQGVEARLEARVARVAIDERRVTVARARPPDTQSMADLVLGTGGDGFNGDTMDGVPASFYDTAAARGRPLALEPEVGDTIDIE